MEKIEVGSLVVFLEEFKGNTLPNVGIVVEIVTFGDVTLEGCDSKIIWYAVMFGEVGIVVSSEMVTLLN